MPQITGPFTSINLPFDCPQRRGAALGTPSGGRSIAGARRPHGWALRLDQAAADRVAGELDAVAHAELVEDVLPMPLDGLDADHELLGDLLRGVGLGDQ